MNIVVTDGYTINPGDNPWNSVAALGELVVYDRSGPDQVIERSREAQIMVVNKTRISAKTLAELSELEFIAVSATGLDCVDIKAAG